MTEDSKHPRIIRLNGQALYQEIENLKVQLPGLLVVDSIVSQLIDLWKVKNPSSTLNNVEIQKIIEDNAAETNILDIGVWVLYPWLNRLVHTLDEKDFVKVRTARNLFKITPDEQSELSRKKIGVVGLSVGKSVTTVLAMERIAGELRIADFDILELSNLNRIRAGIHEIGLPKVTIVSREISEIDPYIRVTVFDDGISEENVDEFLLGNGKLDLVIEECDNARIKTLVRMRCRKHKIPVVMETSDRTLIDIERYDLEGNLPLLHGLINELSISDNMTNEDWRRILLDCIDIKSVSERGALSFYEIGKSITTWPQLASDVISGGAITAILCRLILLKQHVKSGRKYVDIQSHLENW